MPQTAANVRTVPTEKTCSGSPAKRIRADRPMACALVIGRSSRRVARKTATTSPARTAGGFAPPTSTKRETTSSRAPSRALPPIRRPQQRKRGEARREHDVQARDDEQVVEAAAAVARDHAAVELRGAAEQQRGERAPHVAFERRAPIRGQMREEKAVRPGQRRAAVPFEFDHPRALHRDPVARPGKRHLPHGGRDLLELEVARHPHPVAAVRLRQGGGLPRHEHDDLGRETDPGSLDRASFRRAATCAPAAAGRSRNP